VNRASSDRQRSQLRNKRKRRSQPVEENAEVIAGVGQDGSDRVALLPSEIVAARTVLVLDVANHRFDGRAPPHLSLDGRRYPSLLACM